MSSKLVLKNTSTSFNSDVYSKKQDYRNLIAGFTSSFISRTIVAPLDRLKVIYQVNYQGSKNKPPKVFNGLEEIYKKEGVRGFFRGNLINVIKGSPEVGIRMYLFEKIKWRYLCYHKEKPSNTFLLFSGAFSGVVANAVIFPLEVLKVRIVTTDKHLCVGIINTMKKISHEPGGFINFYSGFEASLASAIPNAGISLYCYEKIKIIVSGKASVDNANYLSTSMIIFVGGLSAIISSTILYPFQTVQARMIMHNLKHSEFAKEIKDNNINTKSYIQKSKFFSSIYWIMKIEGITGFYKGYSPAVLKLSIGNGTGFGIYEKVKQILGVNKTSK